MKDKKDIFEIIKGDDGTSIVDVFVNRKEIVKYLPEVKEGHLVVETDDEEFIDAGNVVGKDGKDGEDGKDGKDYILTNKDKEEIAREIPVPIVEKVIEKREIIKEVPIITNEIKEVAKYETPKEIVKKIESLEGDERLDAKSIKNLPSPQIIRGGTEQFAQLVDVNFQGLENLQIPLYNKQKGQRENNNISSALPDPTTGAGSSSTNITYAPQDGTILYYNVKWFVPSGTVSSVGTTVTSVGTQFITGTSMVGAKLTINGEWRIITAVVNTTTVTVNSAYSTNYTGVDAANWGVYSKLFEATTSGSFNIFLGQQSGGALAGTNMISQSGGSLQTSFGYQTPAASYGYGVAFQNDLTIAWSSTNNKTGTKDLELSRFSAGTLLVSNGVDGSLRDLIARKILINTTTDDGVNQLQMDGGARIGTAAASVPQLTILGGALGNPLVRLVRTVGATAAFTWALSTGGMTFADETNGGVPLALYGGTTLSAHIGLRNTGTAYTTPSLLGATTFATGAGANVPAVNFTIQGGLGTGTGAVGDIYFNTGNTAASGSVHTSTTKMTIKGSGRILANTAVDDGVNILQVNGGAKATAFTDGFINMSFAQINRSGGNVELQFSGASPVRIGGGSANPIVLNPSSGGGATFTGNVSIGASVTNPNTGSLVLSKNGGQFFLENTAGALNEKLRDILNTGQNLQWRAVNDANTIATTYMSIKRTGSAVTTVEFPTYVNIGGVSNDTTGRLVVPASGGIPGTFVKVGGANQIIQQSGSTTTTGWKWMQDEATTGDMWLTRTLSSVDTQVMYFNRTTGNVGINTASPGVPLEVNGSVRFGAITGGTYNGNTVFLKNDNFPAVEFRSASTVKAQILTDVNSGTVYYDVLGNFNIRSAINGGNTLFSVSNGGNIAMGGATANANAILDVQSTTRAFMPPRMTTAQKNAIASPTAGMIVYDTTLNLLCLYTTVWTTL